jgi:hypothetical protein
MVKHIVFWKLNDSVTGQAREDALRRIKEGFEAMHGQIPGLLRIEVGVDFSKGDDSADVVLYSEFESRVALEGYIAHPLHLAMVPVVREVRIERRVGDYEV